MQISELFWLSLGVAAIVIPIAALLGVAAAAARQIDQHTSEIWSVRLREIRKTSSIRLLGRHRREPSTISEAVKIVEQQTRLREDPLPRFAEAGGIRP
ncbi:MAG: hypothetical protein WED81_06595 [Rhodothermales bacterium]